MLNETNEYYYKYTYYKINSMPHIGDGEKIKWTYLKPNPLGLDTLACKGFEDPQEIIKFICFLLYIKYCCTPIIIRN